MKKITSLLALLALASGCATSGGSKYSAKSNAKKVDYSKTVRSISLGDASSFSCPNKLDASVRDEGKLVNQATACAKANKWSLVEDLSSQILSVNGNSPWGYYFLSLVSEKRDKNMLKSQWMIEKSLEKGTSSVLYYQAGRLHWLNNEKTLAYANFLECLKLDPKHTEANYMMAQMLFNDGSFKEAIYHFKLVENTVSAKQDMYKALYFSYLQVNDYANSLTYLNKVMNQEKGINYSLEKAFLLEKLDRTQDSLDILESVAKQNKNPEQMTYDRVTLPDKIKVLRENLRSVAAAEKKKEISK